jgi:hypothetical protein
MGKRLFNTKKDFNSYQQSLVLEDIVECLDRVAYILMQYKETRDSYKQLLSRYYCEYFPFDPKVYYSVHAWLTHDDCPQPNSVIRCRSILQNRYEELRGDNYHERREQYQQTKDNFYGPRGPDAKA